MSFIKPMDSTALSFLAELNVGRMRLVRHSVSIHNLAISKDQALRDLDGAWDRLTARYQALSAVISASQSGSPCFVTGPRPKMRIVALPEMVDWQAHAVSAVAGPVDYSAPIKFTVWVDKGASFSAVLEIVYSHHILDGLSGALILQMIHEELCRPSLRQTVEPWPNFEELWDVELPSDPFQVSERACDWPLKPFLAPSAFRLHSLQLPSIILDGLISNARFNSTTLTAMLEVLLVGALSRHTLRAGESPLVPGGFAVSTPMTTRPGYPCTRALELLSPDLKKNTQLLGCYVTSINSAISDPDGQFWDLCRDVSAGLHDIGRTAKATTRKRFETKPGYGFKHTSFQHWKTPVTSGYEKSMFQEPNPSAPVRKYSVVVSNLGKIPFAKGHDWEMHDDMFWHTSASPPYPFYLRVVSSECLNVSIQSSCEVSDLQAIAFREDLEQALCFMSKDDLKSTADRLSDIFTV